MIKRDLQSATYRITILSCSVHNFPKWIYDKVKSILPPTLRRRANPLPVLIGLLFCLAVTLANAQDWVRTGTSLGAEKVRLAVPDFKSSTSDAQSTALLKTFNETLWNDLDNSGVVELVSKSFYPLQAPGQPSDVTLTAWNSPPPNDAMLAFGNLAVAAGKVTVQGWLFDVKNTGTPQVLGKQYSDAANEDTTRFIAHKFADEIIMRLGGGIQGICESKIY